MRKWQIMVFVAILSVTAVGAMSVLLYKYYFVPRYMEPIVQDISDYVNREAVVEQLYSEARKLHDGGVLDDDIYARFMRAYNEYQRDDVAYAQRVLDEYNTEEEADSTETTKSTKYASYKVGVEIIKVNDEGRKTGKSDVDYSDERTSERIKSEDIIEAERIIEEAEAEEKAEAERGPDATPTPTPDIVSSAYEKLRVNMTSDEFTTFSRIMRKLDIGLLKTYMSDKEGLKAYLHQQLTDDEYRQCVNLGYKYIYLFLEE